MGPAVEAVRNISIVSNRNVTLSQAVCDSVLLRAHISACNYYLWFAYSWILWPLPLRGKLHEGREIVTRVQSYTPHTWKMPEKHSSNRLHLHCYLQGLSPTRLRMLWWQKLCFLTSTPTPFRTVPGVQKWDKAEADLITENYFRKVVINMPLDPLNRDFQESYMAEN